MLCIGSQWVLAGSCVGYQIFHFALAICLHSSVGASYRECATELQYTLAAVMMLKNLLYLLF